MPTVGTSILTKPAMDKPIDQKEVLAMLSRDHPILSKYQDLCEQRRKLGGYRGEKLDESLHVLAKTITENKVLMESLVKGLPKVASKIYERVNFRELGREL